MRWHDANGKKAPKRGKPHLIHPHGILRIDYFVKSRIQPEVTEEVTSNVGINNNHFLKEHQEQKSSENEENMHIPTVRTIHY